MYDQNGNKTSIQAGDTLIYHRKHKLLQLSREGKIRINIKIDDDKYPIYFIKDDLEFLSLCILLSDLFGLRIGWKKKERNLYRVQLIQR